MVLDALSISESSPVHANVADSIALVRRFRPRRALLVGMSHNIEHEQGNKVIRSSSRTRVRGWVRG